MEIPYWQRLIGIYVYMLPWRDAIPFGNNLFIEFPFLQWLALPALPLIILERIIPFGNLILFFILFLAVIRNTKIAYFIRFNTLQALLINILIILISYVFQIFILSLQANLLIRTFTSTVFVSVFTVIIFAIIECFRGEEPDLPGISQAVKMQI